MTDFISVDYPKHKSWFYKKHLPVTFLIKKYENLSVTKDNVLEEKE